MSRNPNKLNKFGLWATALYLLLLLTIVPTFAFFGWIVIKPISLNELGDFLAGAFGPLAIFWLVLGFFQQGRELQNSIETLKLQANELANSVQQQKELVSVAKAGLEHEKEQFELDLSERKKSKLPRFKISLKGNSRTGSTTYYKLEIANAGAPVSNADIYLRNKDSEQILYERVLHFKNGDLTKREFSAVSPIDTPFELQLNYQNSDNNPCENMYRLAPAPDASWSEEFGVSEIHAGEIDFNNPQCS